MEAFKVLDPGPLTTVQDLGRMGFGRFGVPVSGALDSLSAKAANLLVGNPADAALLEISFMGPKLEVLSPAEVAVTGAEIAVQVNGEVRPNWSSFQVQAGDKLSFKLPTAGLRTYLAVAGGLDVPRIMGSRSTYTGAKLGGYGGRALAKGDVLKKGQGRSQVRDISLPTELRPVLAREIELRALAGPQDDFFDQGLEIFFSSDFKVSSKADRMGYRLEGPVIVQKEGMPQSIISEPSLPGGVQIPPDGQPIILLVEQTVGGYTKAATVITPDIGKVAQARPGDTVRFRRVSLEVAHDAYAQFVALEKKISQALA